MRTIGKDEYLVTGQIFHWALAEHYRLWYTGKSDRHRRTEQMLPRLVKAGKLITATYGKKLTYAVPRIKNTSIPHGLGVTETIVRICRSSTGGEYIPERHFKGLGSVPDWGINWDGKLLLVEFSTQSDFEAARVMKIKTTNYTYNLPKIVERFHGESAIVLFVVDISQERITNFVRRSNLPFECYFTDFKTFKAVPLGQQLISPIYIWRDGESYPLKK